MLASQITNSFIDSHSVNIGTIDVETETLESFCVKNNIYNIDILKMDVQGGELKVLKGAENLLINKSIDFIYSEIWFLAGYIGQPLYHDLATYLNSLGYSPFALFNMHYGKDGRYLWGDALFYKQA